MIKVEKKIKGVKLNEFWFLKKPKLSEVFRVTSYRNYLGIKPKFMFKDISYTIEIDLLQSEEEVFSAFKSNFRNEIRKAEKFNFNFKLNDLSYTEFVKFYNTFASVKKISTLSLSDIKKYNSKNLIFLSAYNEEGELLIVHSYLINGDYARLLHSASQIHGLEDKEKRKLIGFFNKRLHWMAILYFKNNSYKVYDWGGYARNTENRSLQGINAFKMSFGGKEKKVINYNSFLFQVIRIIKSLNF